MSDMAEYCLSNAQSLFDLYDIDPNNIPQHVAIIMDGNRRWAKQHGVPIPLGHWKGAECITQIVKIASSLGIKVLTVYAFSTENWKRSQEEVGSLMLLFQAYLTQQKESMVAQGVKLDAIGDLGKLPLELREALEDVKQATAGGVQIELVLALNYGGRDDIVRAMRHIASDCTVGKLKEESINEELICSYLDTAKWADPNLLIRTSGEKRLSNFLLWQVSYTEVILTDILWPDFTPLDLVHSIKEYQSRQRRVGGL